MTAEPYTVAAIEQAIRESWSLDTADEDDGWTPDNPSRGQCDITSLVVHDFFGGEILAADVYRDGFRRGEVIGEPIARPRPATFEPTHPRYHRYEQYLVLSARVRARLGLGA